MSSQLGIVGWELPVPAGGRAGHWSMSSCTVRHLFLLGFNPLSLFPLRYFVSVVKLSLSLPRRFTVSLWGRELDREWLCGTELPAGVKAQEVC